MTTTPERAAVFTAVENVNAAAEALIDAMEQTVNGHPLAPIADAVPPLRNAIAELDAALVNAATSEGGTTPSPTPTPAPTPTPTPTPAPSPAPSPSPTPAPSPAPAPSPSPAPGAVGVFQFTGTPATSDPHIAGMLILRHWSDVETTEGAYDFSSIEQLAQPWIDAGKKVAIRIQGVVGNGQRACPPYVLDQAGVLDASLFVPNYLSPAYKNAHANLACAFAAWVGSWAHKDRVAWLEWGVGIYGETKPDSEQGHTIPLAAFTAAGYTNATWDAFVVGDVQVAINALKPLGLPVVVNMDRSFIFSDSGYTPASLGGQLRAIGAWLGDHGFREGVTPETMYLAGPTIFEQYLSTSSTGNNADTELAQMLKCAAQVKAPYCLLYGSDIAKAQATLATVAA